MENIFYLISISSNCIEGICLTKEDNNLTITKDKVVFSWYQESNSKEKTDNFNLNWIKQIDHFLDRQKWKNHSIAFIISAEEVTFRKITFPFNDRKKFYKHCLLN